MNQLIKEITTATDTEVEEMKKQVTKEFREVKNCLELLVDVVLKRAPEEDTVQEFGSINSVMRIQNAKIPLHAIKTNNEDLNASYNSYNIFPYTSMHYPCRHW